MHCGGEMKRGTTPFHVDRHGFHLVMDAIQNVIRAIDEQSLPLRGTA